MTTNVLEHPHAHPVEEVFDDVASGRTGLTSAEAVRRLASEGPNVLPEARRDGLVRRILRLVSDVLIVILILAAVVTALLGHWIDTGVILLVVVINTAVGLVQEGRAEKALEGIRRMLSTVAEVRRDGRWVDVPTEEVVVGDVVRFGPGDQVPADVRLYRAVSLRVEESALTGESVPADKDTDPVAQDCGIGDRHGMAHSGTLVAGGRGAGVVVRTGADTEIGRISTLVSQVEQLQTPLTRQMNVFGKRISVIIVAAAFVLFVFALLFHDYGLDEIGLASIGLAVSAIPEGLPAILTITLARGVQIMAGRNAIVRKLPSVETLGSVTTICSDKTGTLTRNEMIVRRVITADDDYEVDGIGYAPEGAIRRTADREPVTGAAPDLRAFAEVMGVNNDADLILEDGGWQLRGEATEGALLALAAKAGVDRARYERLDVIPFDSGNKFMATLNEAPDGSRPIMFKGAPDRLFDRCTGQLQDGRVVPLDRQAWEARVDRLGAEGLRVLAAARRDGGGTGRLTLDDLGRDFVLLGVAGLLDPPRPEAVEAVASCHEAGITVRMITGDHATTAAAIAREMGLGVDPEPVTGPQIEAADDEELRVLARDHVVFARTSPEHKYRLVKALQADGQVVAMTGDGVNDAPALKRADVGVAMGITGTEATKEAADVVLTDDNFASIQRAVSEGRTIYDNLRKSIVFILPTNGGEALVVIVAILAGWTLPLNAVQILWVNMVTAVTLTLALAFEPAEGDVMRRSPRDVNAGILDRRMLGRIALVSVVLGLSTLILFRVMIEDGAELEAARTVVVNALVLGQCFYLLNARFLRSPGLRPSRLSTNRVVWAAIASALALQVCYMYLPFLQVAFGSVPLTGAQWLWTVGVGVLVLVVVEGEKAILRNRDTGARPQPAEVQWRGRAGEVR